MEIDPNVGREEGADYRDVFRLDQKIRKITCWTMEKMWDLNRRTAE